MGGVYSGPVRIGSFVFYNAAEGLDRGISMNAHAGAAQPDEPLLKEIDGHYHEGRYLAAWSAAQRAAPLRQWRSAEASVLAGRLAHQLGAHRLGTAIHLAALRRYPSDPYARYFGMLAFRESRGSWETWERVKGEPDLAGAPAAGAADWVALRAELLAGLRDFERAEEEMRRALAIDARRAWLHVVHAHILDREDRREEGLERAREALRLRPWYRPAVQAAAHLLTETSRDEEALALLREAMARIESGSVAAQLFYLERELGLVADAARTLDEFERRTPIAEAGFREYLVGLRSDLAHRRGERAVALQLARQSGLKRLGDTLESAAPGARRRVLPVPFVRQNHLTCAPATLAAIARYWEMPAEQMEIAGRICYDGTPNHSERQWAATHGFEAREFRADWPTTVALIDRGVPFTLVTRTARQGHLQAVIGFDEARRTLVLREPGSRLHVEAFAEPLFEEQRDSGPRGMALVPVARKELLEGLALPDAEAHDVLHEVHLALEAHDRDAAERHAAALAGRFPGHRLAWMARLSLGRYDGNLARQLEAIEGLLGLAPESRAFRAAQMDCLAALGRRAERRQVLERVCSDPHAHPVFLEILAEETLADARDESRTRWLVRNAIRGLPERGGPLSLLGELRWRSGDREGAAAAWRASACLDWLNEDAASRLFRAARATGRPDTGLGFLERRNRLLGDLSGAPAQTLFFALDTLDRTAEGFEVLDEAIRRRPDDGGLLLFAAERRSFCGAAEDAQKCLERARGRAHEAHVLAVEASIAHSRGDFARALRAWRRALELQPLDLEVHDSVARLVCATGGPAAALAGLEQSLARFPTHAGLHHLLLRWLRLNDPSRVEAAARRALESDPRDDFAWRELAWALLGRGEFEEARRAGAEAARLAPAHPAGLRILAEVEARQGRKKEARALCERAVRLDADSAGAVGGLLDCCDTAEERREALGFVESELERQGFAGEGFREYVARARAALTPAELLPRVLRLRDAWPGCAAARAAAAEQLAEAGKPAEAAQAAEEACRRYPFSAEIQFCRAGVARAARDWKLEEECLREALRLDPASGVTARRLSELRLLAGDAAGARALLEQAMVRGPLDSWNHVAMARLLWSCGERDGAIARYRRALELEPGFLDGWDEIADWCGSLERAEDAVAFARELAAARPRTASVWLALSRLLLKPGDAAERLEALDRAIALNQRDETAHDLRAVALADGARFDEAEAACSPAVFGGQVPVSLSGRRAWILVRRGKLAEGIAEMKRLLAAEPMYGWGWGSLVEWQHDAKDWLGATASAASYAAAFPGSARAMAYLGDAHLQAAIAGKPDVAAHRKAARTYLQKALELEPGMEGAARRLLTLQIEAKDLDAAERTAETAALTSSAGFLAASRVRVAAGRNRPADVTKHLEAFLRAPDATDWDVEPILNALSGAHMLDALSSMLRLEAARPEASAIAGRMLAWDLFRRTDYQGAEKFFHSAPPSSRSWEAAAESWIEGLAGRRQAGRLIAFLQYHEKSVMARVALKDAAVGALMQFNESRRAARYAEGWRERPGLDPGMLLNIAIIELDMSRDAEAAEACRRSAGRRSGDAGACLATLAGWIAASSGDAAAAREELRQADRRKLRPYFKAVHALAAACAAASGPKPCSFREFLAMRTDVSAARVAAAAGGKDEFFRKIYRETIRRVARRRGDVLAFLWKAWMWE